MLGQIRFCSVILFFLCSVNLYSNQRVLEYVSDKQEFTVTVLVDDGMCYKEAKEIAMERSTLKAKKLGYKYFIIKSEEKALVLEGEKNWPNAYEFPQNLYDEEIIQRSFNSDIFYQQSDIDSLKKAIRFVFKFTNTRVPGAQKTCDIQNSGLIDRFFRLIY
jgi:hypothetical protein